MNIVKLSIVVLVIAFISGCSKSADIKQEREEVRKVVDKLEQQIENEDMELLDEIFAEDNNIVVFGTDIGEEVVGWKDLQSKMAQQNESLDEIKLTVSKQSIQISKTGSAAWFSELMDWDFVSGGQKIMMHGSRVTGVLEKRDGNWVIVQLHFSVPRQ